MINGQHMSDGHSAGAPGTQARLELPECGCSSVLQGAGGQVLMLLDCPGFSPNMAGDWARKSGKRKAESGKWKF